MALNLATLRGAPSFAGAGKFGSASLSGGCMNNATADSFLSATGANGGALTTGTIEGWVKTTNDTSYRVAFGHQAWFWVGKSDTGTAQARYGVSPNEVLLTSSAPIADNTWHHVALVLSGGAGTLYVDGTQVATNASARTTGTPATGVGFVVGGFGESADGTTVFDWNGSVDEVRLSTTARYTGSTFTVPGGPFTDSASDSAARAVYHLDGSGVDTAQSVAGIGPSDAGILYSPYNWAVSAGVAETINSGAYFKTLLGGVTAMTLTFDMSGVSSPLPQITYRVDHGPWTSVPVAASVPLTMPSGNAWGRHALEVVVKSTTETANRWNAPRNAAVKFTGIIPAVSGTLTVTKPTTRNLRVLVLGDSITEGVRTLTSTATDDTDRNDARQGWAWQLAEAVGAEVGVVGFGGTGLSVAGSGNVPALPSSYASLWSGTARSFASQPDVIVVNIGTNDATTDTTTAATTLLNGLLAATTARIVVLRPFGGTAQASFLQAAAAACADPKRVSYVSTAGWWSTADSSDSIHPFGYANTMTLGPLVAQAVRAALARGATWINVGGTAKAATIIRR